jgi:hypothetical protein
MIDFEQLALWLAYCGGALVMMPNKRRWRTIIAGVLLYAVASFLQGYTYVGDLPIEVEERSVTI